MAQRVAALIGFPRVMGKVAARFASARAVRVGFGLAVVPLTLELLREMLKSEPDKGRWVSVAARQDAGFVGVRTMEWAAHFSQHGQVGVLVWKPGPTRENQEATLWLDGANWDLSHKPGEQTQVDQVLLGLGVVAQEDDDLFKALGLHKINSVEDWLKAKPPKPVGDVPVGRWELDEKTIRIFSEPGVEAMKVAVDDVMAVGEMTDVGGPFADDWWLVVCLRDGTWIRWLVSSPGTHMEELLRGLSELWGAKLELGLAHSVQFHSRVMWPDAIKERVMFEILPDRPATGWRGWLGMTAPEEYVLTAELKAIIGDGK